MIDLKEVVLNGNPDLTDEELELIAGGVVDLIFIGGRALALTVGYAVAAAVTAAG